MKGTVVARTMDNGQGTREQGNNGKNNRTMNNGKNNGTMDKKQGIRNKEQGTMGKGP